MTQIQRLKADLARRFPDLALELDVPDDERGPWFLDVRRGGGASPIVVEWRPDRGFGVSTLGEDDVGSGADERHPNAKATFERVVRLVLSGGETNPPTVVDLAGLRRSRGLSQAELAGRAGVSQASVAKLEGRDDILVGTLARIVAAMGAELSIWARFPDGTEKELGGFEGTRGPEPQHIHGEAAGKA